LIIVACERLARSRIGAGEKTGEKPVYVLPTGSTIGLSPVGDSKNEHQNRAFLNLTDETIVSDAIAPKPGQAATQGSAEPVGVLIAGYSVP
jgi:hypothetical protein